MSVTMGNNYNHIDFNGDRHMLEDSAGRAMTAPKYSDLTPPIQAGQLCVQNNLLYRCSAPITTAEDFNAAHWDEIVLGKEFEILNRETQRKILINDGVKGLEFLPGFFGLGSSSTAVNIETRTSSVSGTLVSAVTECAPGDRFICTLSGAGSSSGGARAYAFLNSERKPISGAYAAANTDLTDQILYAPNNAAYCIFNTKFAGVDYYVIKGKPTAEKIKDLDAAMDGMLYDLNAEALWEQGTLSGGGNSASTTRLRTKTYLSDNVRRIKAENGYTFAAAMYNKETGAYVGPVLNNGTVGTGNFFFMQEMDFSRYSGQYRARLVLKNPDNDTMSTSEAGNIALNALTDGTLTRDSVPADAAAVGEKFRQGFTTRRNNPTYVGQLLTIARTYLNRGAALEYGNQGILNKSTETNEIDCSTYVGLCLRGYGYEDTSYYTQDWAAPESWVANEDYNWTINPFEWENIDKSGDASPIHIRWAAQMAQWMAERGQIVPMDEHLANLMPGDIIFWARKDPETGAWREPKRYMHISHVAICLSKEAAPTDDASWDTEKYPWKHEAIQVGTAVDDNVCKITVVESGQGDDPPVETTNNVHTIVLICRPDLGSI